MRAREETIELTVHAADRDHPGDSLRDLLMQRFWHELFGKRRFKVGSARYVITIKRLPIEDPT